MTSLRDTWIKTLNGAISVQLIDHRENEGFGETSVTYLGRLRLGSTLHVTRNDLAHNSRALEEIEKELRGRILSELFLPYYTLLPPLRHKIIKVLHGGCLIDRAEGILELLDQMIPPKV